MSIGVRIVTGRWVDDVQTETESLVDDLGDEPALESVGEFKTGIGVDFDKPGHEVAVNHEVHAKKLKVMLKLFRTKLQTRTLNRIKTDFFHAR